MEYVIWGIPPNKDAEEILMKFNEVVNFDFIKSTEEQLRELYTQVYIQVNMNKKELAKARTIIQMHFNYAKAVAEQPEMKPYIEAKYNFQFITECELQELVEKITYFNINLLWDSKFWGLRKGESVSAIAVGYEFFIKRLPGSYLRYKEYINQ